MKFGRYTDIVVQKPQFLNKSNILFVLLLLAGCRNFFTDNLVPLSDAQGGLLISFRQAESSFARTILPEAPEFTRYELEFVNPPQGTLSFFASVSTLYLNPGVYKVIGKGYTGDIQTAQSDPTDITISPGGSASVEIGLLPYSSPGVYGTLKYSLSLDGAVRTPALAELLIEAYNKDISDGETTVLAGKAVPAEWLLPRRDSTPAAAENLPQEADTWALPAISLGSEAGTILLLNKGRALQNPSGSVSLPAGEYLLTMLVSMDGGPPVKRTDIAQIYSGLTSSGFFHYGGGEIDLSTGGDSSSSSSSSSFITKFTFDQAPNATSVISGVPGPDGTKIILVTVPYGTDLRQLTPKVETGPGVSVSSPPPSSSAPVPETGGSVFNFPSGDYRGPTSWTAVDEHGNIQTYTLMVTGAASYDKSITGLYFKEFPGIFGEIDQSGKRITVLLPLGTKAKLRSGEISLTPVFSIIGDKVQWKKVDSTYEDLPSGSLKFYGSGLNSYIPQTFTVFAKDNSSEDYTVTISEAEDGTNIITGFAIDGYPDLKVAVTTDPELFGPSSNTITATLPYGMDLSGLKPLIQYAGKTMSPLSGLIQNFNNTVVYTVTAENGVPRRYGVTLKNAPGNTDTGIFSFVVTNVPNAKVVIGQSPRSDREMPSKIPIVIQVPYGTDENNMIPAISLSSSSSSIAYCANPVTNPTDFTNFTPPTPNDGSNDVPIKFTTSPPNGEAYYKVTAQDSTYQVYVVVVSEGPQYYYVNGVTGRDDWPDYYNGESESRAFKTLAKAVHAASRSNSINKIFVSGELNANTEKGAYENAAVSSGFQSSGGDSASVFNLIGTNGKTITVSGINNAVLRGTSGKRVLSVTGGANITFENIAVTGGDTTGNGGGVYIDGDCKVKFSGGSITGNKAASGGGVYVHGPDSGSNDGEFYFIGGSISGNTATGTKVGSIANPVTTQGGGGLYVGGRITATLYNATVANNTAQGGSGGGVLIAAANPNNNSGYRDAEEFGLNMFGGSISQNNSYGAASPHGGGGVYVAQGAFDMDGGNISGNYSKRQGGGVFVWHNARFNASGNSSILNNDGVGSSKAICSRGYTEMMGNARADKIYIWNNNDNPKFSQEPDSFNIAQNARANGIVLAYDDSDSGRHQTRNYINILGLNGSDPVATIDLEGHLTDGLFKTMDLEPDWLGKTLIKTNNSADIARFPLGTFVGSGTRSLSSYKIVRDGVNGKMQRK